MENKWITKMKFGIPNFYLDFQNYFGYDMGYQNKIWKSKSEFGKLETLGISVQRCKKNQI